MATSLSNVFDNLTDRSRKIKCKNCDCFLEYESVKEISMKYKICRSCNRDYSNITDEDLRKRFKNTFKFSNNDINKVILLLRKGVYSYEYMDHHCLKKKEFYSNINIDGIADADYMEAKRVGKDFERKNLGEYHNLYLKDDILLLAVFENFGEMCLNIYHLDPAKILSAPGLEW